jgi:hypothetical protein
MSGAIQNICKVNDQNRSCDGLAANQGDSEAKAVMAVNSPMRQLCHPSALSTTQHATVFHAEIGVVLNAMKSICIIYQSTSQLPMHRASNPSFRAVSSLGRARSETMNIFRKMLYRTGSTRPGTIRFFTNPAVVGTRKVKIKNPVQ